MGKAGTGGRLQARRHRRRSRLRPNAWKERHECPRTPTGYSRVDLCLTTWAPRFPLRGELRAPAAHGNARHCPSAGKCAATAPGLSCRGASVCGRPDGASAPRTSPPVRLTVRQFTHDSASGQFHSDASVIDDSRATSGRGYRRRPACAVRPRRDARNSCRGTPPCNTPHARPAVCERPPASDAAASAA
jgi:hypothetical protein